jgi:NAD(P)H-dependent FMN reductase
MALRLNIVVASTRPGRVGRAVADWFEGVARAHGAFDVHVADLVDFDLPVYDEPRHPRMQQYEHEHTKRWAESVGSADAFALVTPEYNFGPTPALLNALNYVYVEWNYKPAAFVSYGGISGGMRAVQVTKLTLTTLKMVPVLEAVTIPTVSERVKEGRFDAAEIHAKSAETMLSELHRWAEALKPLRG